MHQQCYSRDQLLEFALGRLQEPQARQIERHIDDCASCEETVAILDDATDSLLKHLRASHNERNGTSLSGSD